MKIQLRTQHFGQKSVMLQQLLQNVVQAYWGSANETVRFASACATGFTSHKTLQMATGAEGITALEQKVVVVEREERMTRSCNV